MIHTRLLTLTLVLTSIAITETWAGNADGIPGNAGDHCVFNENIRYSQLVINSRINDFKANTKDAGFGRHDAQGNMTESPTGTYTTLDYVPGLVAKAILEAVDYYKDDTEVEVRPWFYTIAHFGNSCDISSSGKAGRSFDDLNAVKLYFLLSQLAAEKRFDDTPTYTGTASIATARQRFSDSRKAFASSNSNYVIKESTLTEAAGGWWHKASYTDQMWCDGLYMGAALMAQLINGDTDYSHITADDWQLLTRQFTISWKFLWDDDVRLLYHAFTADPAGTAASQWAGISAQKGQEVYHSVEFWGRSVAWYFLALVDVLEQMQKAGLGNTERFTMLSTYLEQLAAGIAAKQDAESGCWYQLLNHDSTFIAASYNSSYRYTSSPVANYLESSCTAIFTAAFLKGMRLGLIKTDYSEVALKAYHGFINHFMVADGNGGVHLVGCCKSAGLGGSNYRDGSAEYYLMGKDTKPTSTSGSDFYTEGKVLGGFIMAATEYERLMASTSVIMANQCQPPHHTTHLWSLSGWRLSGKPLHQVYIKDKAKILSSPK